MDRDETLDVLTGLVLGAAAGGGERTAANTGVRIKAAQTLARSVAAAGRFPGTLQAAFHCLFGADATPKLMQACTPAAHLRPYGCSPVAVLVHACRHIGACMY